MLLPSSKLSRTVIHRHLISHLRDTVTSHEPHGISNHRQLDCVLSSSVRLAPKLRITGPLWWESIVIDGFPSQSASNGKSVSCHEVNMASDIKLNCTMMCLVSQKTPSGNEICMNNLFELPPYEMTRMELYITTYRCFGWYDHTHTHAPAHAHTHTHTHTHTPSQPRHFPYVRYPNSQTGLNIIHEP